MNSEPSTIEGVPHMCPKQESGIDFEDIVDRLK